MSPAQCSVDRSRKDEVLDVQGTVVGGLWAVGAASDMYVEVLARSEGVVS